MSSAPLRPQANQSVNINRKSATILIREALSHGETVFIQHENAL
jgi:hypothetical protein